VRRVPYQCQMRVFFMRMRSRPQWRPNSSSRRDSVVNVDVELLSMASNSPSRCDGILGAGAIAMVSMLVPTSSGVVMLLVLAWSQCRWCRGSPYQWVNFIGVGCWWHMLFCLDVTRSNITQSCHLIPISVAGSGQCNERRCRWAWLARVHDTCRLPCFSAHVQMSMVPWHSNRTSSFID
jgi:hypothetical protein